MSFSRLLLTAIFFVLLLWKFMKDKELQVVVKIRGRRRFSEVKKTISCTPRFLLLVYPLRPDLLIVCKVSKNLQVFILFYFTLRYIQIICTRTELSNDINSAYDKNP